MRIREIREGKGIKQSALADAMNVIPSVISNWENEVALPRTRDLPMLANALSCTIDDLYVGGGVADGQ